METFEVIDNGYGLRKIRKGSPKNLRSYELQGSLALADEATGSGQETYQNR